jgi:hypothetical protein
VVKRSVNATIVKSPNGSRTLAEVRDAAGHANVSITSGYLHVAVEDDGEVGRLFGFACGCRLLGVSKE